MGKRFLHNRAAVITVAIVLLIGLIGILAPPFWLPTTLMPMISSTNLRLTAWSTHWAPTIWAGASFPG